MVHFLCKSSPIETLGCFYFDESSNKNIRMFILLNHSICSVNVHRIHYGFQIHHILRAHKLPHKNSLDVWPWNMEWRMNQITECIQNTYRHQSHHRHLQCCHCRHRHRHQNRNRRHHRPLNRYRHRHRHRNPSRHLNIYRVEVITNREPMDRIHQSKQSEHPTKPLRSTVQTAK